MAEAQQSESHIIEFQDWLNDVDAQLTARIDNDLTADDLPDDVQVNLSLFNFNFQPCSDHCIMIFTHLKLTSVIITYY